MPPAPVSAGTIPAAAAPARGGGELPRIRDPRQVSPADARALTKLFLERLQVLEEGTHEYAYARNTLIEMSMSLVHYVARRFHRPDATEDVVQVGMIGLIKAIDRFDLTREVEFTSFAIPYIVGEIKRFFRDTSWSVHVPRRLQELRTELARAKDTLHADLDRDPTVPELAAHLGRTEEEVRDGIVAANGYHHTSLDTPYRNSDGSEGQATLADFTGACDPGVEFVDDLTSLGPLIAELDDRDRRILELRFGQEMTQAEIGRELGLSQMHVSRLLSRALQALRAGLLED